MNDETREKFFADTNETGRFCVTSRRTGRTYYVEPIGTHGSRKWGSIDPATKKLTHKKGDGKYTGAIDESESLITEGNGFINIRVLDKGVSPLKAIEMLDAQYPDKKDD